MTRAVKTIQGLENHKYFQIKYFSYSFVCDFIAACICVQISLKLKHGLTLLQNLHNLILKATCVSLSEKVFIPKLNDHNSPKIIADTAQPTIAHHYDAISSRMGL